ncbi:hypothetical protein [Methylocella tundrae]|nr:hypothetical protein [Methylocella tundrae]WPP04787.1 hypothetical protein SIN04_02840 [Methylocella tundrae]
MPAQGFLPTLGATPSATGLSISQGTAMAVSAVYCCTTNRRAIAVGAGTIKSTLKATAARISGQALGALYYGVTPTVGQTAYSMAEAHSVPSATPWTVTIAPPGSGVFFSDQGVVYAATGLPFTRVATVTAAGQYSVVPATGVYTFGTADQSALVLISYGYTVTAAGQSIAVGNPILGNTVSFGGVLYFIDPTTNKTGSFSFYNAVSSKFSFGTKLTDFTLPDFEASLFVNAAGLLGNWSFPDGY